MKRVTNWLFGWCSLTITGGSPDWLLNRLTAAKIPFWNVIFSDEFTLKLCVYHRDLYQTDYLAQRSICSVCNVQEFGFLKLTRSLKKRWYFLFLIGIALAAALSLSGRIWFFSVDGNRTVPADKIIRAVRAGGVEMGTAGKKIVPQDVENLVLESMPELAWLTVTQKGCCAKIIVREKVQPQGMDDRRVPQNIISTQNGIVEEIIVLDGSPVVQPGDMVKAGDLLISGYMDLEYKIRATRAEGEIFARTWRNMTLKTPAASLQKCYTGKVVHRYSLIFGKSQINLSRGSGIFTTGCDKMTVYIPLTLPGGYELPVALVKDSYHFYETQWQETDSETAKQMLLNAAAEMVERSMIAGKIQKTVSNAAADNGLVVLDASFECREMIGTPVDAGIFKED